MRVRWFHSHAEDPEWIYSELDDQRWERRKVEIFHDGRLEFADGCSDSDTGTGLGETPVPALHEIATNREFAPEKISREEFEVLWTKAKAGEPARSMSAMKMRRSG